MRADSASKFKRGEDLPQSKMTAELVRSARAEYIEGRRVIQDAQKRYSVQGLADRYGISKAAMEKILYRNTWDHVK